ncbi:hypothetical protein [Christiangramia portivictoriae]|uniref:hypothetical protein n=1 Tax=Christiangramia portivictoriae TaxID=326069 RepID=UPI00047A0896|nr:hypothetical protein [Christiangramia portivictoriae]
MKKENKVFVKQFFISGSLFAVLMAGFYYILEDGFEILKFIFHFISFGLIMGFLARRDYKKRKN